MAEGKQVSVILKNEPGELARLSEIFERNHINILAISIQNAKNFLMELFRAREKTGRRITMADHYRGILRETASYSLIRLLVDRPDEAEEELLSNGYATDSSKVLVLAMDNRPGILGKMARQLALENINIDYVYGSAMDDAERSIFVFHVDENDWERASTVFSD